MYIFKNIRSIYLLVIITISSIVGIACGGDGPDESEMTIFQSESFIQESLSPFFFKPDELSLSTGSAVQNSSLAPTVELAPCLCHRSPKRICLYRANPSCIPGGFYGGKDSYSA